LERLSESDAGLKYSKLRESIVQGAATTEHCQNTALHVWEVPGKNPNEKTGGLQNRS